MSFAPLSSGKALHFFMVFAEIEKSAFFKTTSIDTTPKKAYNDGSEQRRSSRGRAVGVLSFDGRLLISPAAIQKKTAVSRRRFGPID